MNEDRLTGRGLVVLRLNHRNGRDDRITTHVCLVGRAFGADGAVITDSDATTQASTLRKVNAQWGGRFWVEGSVRAATVISKWKSKRGIVVNLSMYGESLQDTVSEISYRYRIMERGLLIVVGSSKVPGYIYKMSDYNVAVTHEPHSEIAALAVFLEKITKPLLSTRRENAELKVFPRLCNKGRVGVYEKEVQ
jgi:tRNA (cytidine56-2'-O)-methyltransferase